MSAGEDSGLLDGADKVANIVIATCTFFFSIYIYYKTFKRDETKDAENKRLELFKTLILEHNLSHFYAFFDNIISHSNVLLTRVLTPQEKMAINDNYLDELHNFRMRFYDMIMAIDADLYSSIKNESDNLVDELTAHLSSSTLSLHLPSVYQHNIITTVSRYRTSILKKMYEFK
ncbi:hypothetical protein R1T16_13770 [Flavobacterium sp. DG1-102-2]|uniref:hypothetical protein n=1 Tax=Flavobacterium sp. DG1-102-2 TaxID=3081663 RepID=UPI002949B496|nr:hypothetical protein [Flavobacterium sp. DG1-102-2]MDV6169499.1 hypothetical protein [Flavobacterium sp. DG1-102-2]